MLLRHFPSSACTGTPSSEQRFQYTINAGTAVTAPPGRAHARPELLRHEHLPDRRRAEPRRVTYEVRYARGGVVGPDGAISGPSAETFVDRTTGLADFRFDKPGRWLIVARVKGGNFFTPWSAPVNVNAIAPFDLERTSFPDGRGPSYKVRGQVRERAARGKVTVSIARAQEGQVPPHRQGEDQLQGPLQQALQGAQDRRLPAPLQLPRAPRSWRPAASPSRSASAAASSSASRQLSGPAGVASGAGSSTTLRHCTMRRWRIRKAVLASPPTPEPQRPGPGALGQAEPRDHERARVLDAQHLRAARQRAVEERTSSRLVSRIGGCRWRRRWGSRSSAPRARPVRGAARPPSRG